MTEPTRAYIYRIATATIPMLVTIGLITSDLAAHILNISAAVLATAVSGLAVRHTSTK